MRVLVYACNWCSYAGADLAGVGRMQYPASTRILRIMCTGRLSEALLLYPFLEGFDGVLVCGCHIGDCHYIAGNKKAMEVVEKTKKLLSLLNIEEERLQFHQISAAEASLFAQTLTKFTQTLSNMPSLLFEEEEEPPPISFEDILRESKVYMCYNCAGCTATCPVAGERKEFNPRRRIRRALYGREDAADFEIHTCLTCGLCRERCPKGVDIIEFIKGVRALSKTQAIAAHDGAVEIFIRLQAKVKKPSKKVKEWAYYPGCTKFFDTLFNKDLSKIEESCIKLLQKIGIDVDTLNAPCCGHDLLFNGARKEFYNVAKRCLLSLKESGAKEIIVSCPECLYMFCIEYPKMFGPLPFNVHYMGELLLQRGFCVNGARDVILQDSCRLSRFLKKGDVVHRLLSGRVSWMRRSGNEAMCCGSSAWRNCFFCNKKIQSSRILEAIQTGASTLLTICPKCKIHLECVKEERINIKDLFVYINECK